jgi:hypothetical protein
MALNSKLYKVVRFFIENSLHNIAYGPAHRTERVSECLVEISNKCFELALGDMLDSVVALVSIGRKSGRYKRFISNI